MNPDDLILGVDGGGSKTVAWLAIRDDPSEGGTIGRGQAGPSNLQAVGLTVATENVDQAIAAAFDDARITMARVSSACLALAGAGRDADQAAIRSWAEATSLAERITVTHDALPLLYVGSTDGSGVALVSGTGSFAFGRTDGGVTARSGGWGPLLGDEGSGYAIALDGLRAAAAAADGRAAHTTLLDRFLQYFGVTDSSGLVAAVYDPGLTRADVARLAGTVFDETQDSVAIAIVGKAADELARMVGAVVDRLALQDSIRLTLAGGVLLHQAEFRHAVCDRLPAHGVELGPTSLARQPVVGALAIARRA